MEDLKQEKTNLAGESGDNSEGIAEAETKITEKEEKITELEEIDVTKREELEEAVDEA